MHLRFAVLLKGQRDDTYLNTLIQTQLLESRECMFLVGLGLDTLSESHSWPNCFHLCTVEDFQGLIHYANSVATRSINGGKRNGRGPTRYCPIETVVLVAKRGTNDNTQAFDTVRDSHVTDITRDLRVDRELVFLLVTSYHSHKVINSAYFYNFFFSIVY